MTVTSEAMTAETFGERVFESVLGAMDMWSIYLGEKLGYYDVLTVDDGF